MTADDFEAYLRDIGLGVEVITGGDNQQYTVIRDYTILAGALRGRTCDIAIQRSDAVPYIVPAAIHTRPPLVPMSGGEPLGTQASSIGPEWQYWSRRFDRPVTPPGLWAHILTVLYDERWRTD
jgi:hypothetical protein